MTKPTQGQGLEQGLDLDADTIPPVRNAFWEELEKLLKNVPVAVITTRVTDARIQRQAREHIKTREKEAPLPPRWRLRRNSA